MLLGPWWNEERDDVEQDHGYESFIPPGHAKISRRKLQEVVIAEHAGNRFPPTHTGEFLTRPLNLPLQHPDFDARAASLLSGQGILRQ